MKYVILYEDVITSKIALLIREEIQRFDIRNEIDVLNINDSNTRKTIKALGPELAVVVGTIESIKIIQFLKKYGSRICFLHQSLIDSRSIKFSRTKIDRIFTDLPLLNTDGVQYNGNLLYEYVRKNIPISNDPGDTPAVAIVCTRESEIKSIKKLKRNLEKDLIDTSFVLIDLESNFEDAITKISSSNVTIATDQLSNMIGVFTNCPIINVYKKNIFWTPINRESIINQLIKKKVVSDFSIKSVVSISDEITKLLSDHQHCASIMDGYQELKSIIGTSNNSRIIGKEIVEWLEDDLGRS